MRFAEITPWKNTMENSIVSEFFHFWMYASDRRDAGREICEDRCVFFFFLFVGFSPEPRSDCHKFL